MTKIDFTNWLHSELDAVFNRKQTPEQMMLKAIPMIHELSSQNNDKPTALSSRESVVNECRDELLKQLFKVFHTNGYPIEAVPKATILSLPQLMRCSSSPHFSLEDMKKAIEMAQEVDLDSVSPLYTKEEIIQSLSTQQLPSEFILGQGETIEEQIKNGYYVY